MDKDSSEDRSIPTTIMYLLSLIPHGIALVFMFLLLCIFVSMIYIACYIMPVFGIIYVVAGFYFLEPSFIIIGSIIAGVGGCSYVEYLEDPMSDFPKLTELVIKLYNWMVR